MPPEFPLHVQVAKALGWTELSEHQSGMAQEAMGRWIGKEPHGGLTLVVPRYDSSWCSSGILAERFGISVIKSWISQEWEAYTGYGATADGPEWLYEAKGKTPCESIANLIVELSKQGKLNG